MDQEEKEGNMDTSENDQEGSQEEKKEEEKPKAKPMIFDRTSVLLARSHDDKNYEDECSYCEGKRIVDDPETGEKDILEEGNKYRKLGFTTTKMRADDLEHCLDMGFTRCGTYIYQRHSRVSCCEVWQYRVNTDDFKMSAGQKKVIRRLHKYLDHGDIHGAKEEEKNEQKLSNEIMGVDNE